MTDKNVFRIPEITPEMARSHHLYWLLYSSGGYPYEDENGVRDGTWVYDYRAYKHIARMGKHFMEVLAGRRHNRTIIQIPPQHCKSSTATEGLATYFLGSNPGKRVGICSYNADLAEDFGYRNKQRMLDYGGKAFGVEIDKARKSKADWGLDGYPTGGMVSVGVGGSLTGKRLDLLIIDDAFKNYEDSMSSSSRNKVWNWLMTVAFTRLSRSAPIIVIGTRWHPDDHIGRLIEQSKDSKKPQFDVINFPAIAVEDEFGEDGTPFRKKGDPLCPELHPIERLEEMKSQMSNFQWSALYQQDPTSPEGTHWPPQLFGPEVFIERWPNNMETLVAALDPSTGQDTKRGDYPALSVLGTAGTGHFYVDSIMRKLPPSGMAVAVADKFSELKEETGMYPALFGVEKQGLSELYMEKLYNEFKRRGIPTPILPVSHENVNKLLRIQRLDPQISGKDIRFMQNRDTSLVVQQLKDFPTGSHDDGPDSLEMAFRVLFACYAMK